jgi:hypothetical protein
MAGEASILANGGLDEIEAVEQLNCQSNVYQNERAERTNDRRISQPRKEAARRIAGIHPQRILVALCVGGESQMNLPCRGT